MNGLSERQVTILREVAKGKQNQEVAETLGLKISTVRNNLSGIYKTLGFENRVQAMLWALHNDPGLLEEILSEPE